ncbi:MAG: HlyD family secretion protein [Gammaproteobacteria bacterium]|jgi:membrane fusion protein (multidrug efflux system)
MAEQQAQERWSLEEPAGETSSPSVAQRIIPYFVAVVAVAAFVWIGAIFVDRYTHLYIDDARVGSEVISIASRVPGWITQYYVGATDVVKRGDLLVSLDAREADTKVAELKARLAEIQAEREQLQTKLAMADQQTSSHYQAYEFRLAAAEAILSATESDLALARSDFERSDALLKTRVVSRKQWEEDRAQFLKAQKDYQRAQADVATAKASLVEAEAERQQLEVLAGEQSLLTHREEQVKAELLRAEIDLDNRNLRSPVDGVIDRTFANDGEYVLPGQRLLMLHDRAEVWVDANVVETDIRHLHVGMPATVWVDAFPDEVFEGEIIRVGDAATSQFALLPNPNPSGNFTKIAQRLPIRIALEQRGNMLRPGMMVEVGIAIDR